MLLVSDIHFGSNRSEDVNAFLKDARDPEINPERIVIIAGDITQRAREEEFREADRFIENLFQHGLMVIYTPGNHDFGDWIGEYLKTNKKARERTRSLLRSVLSQKEVVAADDFDYICKVGKEVFVVLRSTHRGEIDKFGIFGNNRISSKQIKRAHSRLSAVDTGDCRLHLITHRSLWRESGDRHSGMVKRRRLEESFIGHFGFHSMIHGHNHRFVFARTSTPKLGIPIIRLGLPTLSTRTNKWQTGYVRWDFPYDRSPWLIVRRDRGK